MSQTDVPDAVSTEHSPTPESDRTRTLLAVVLVTAGLAATAATSAHALLVGVAVVQAALILGWVLGTGMPGRIGAVLIAVAAAAGADVAATAWPGSAMSPLLAPLGLGILAMFVHQLSRGVVRARVVESVSGVAAVLVAAVALTVWLQLRHEFDGRAMALAGVLAAGTGVAVSLLADLVWSRPRLDPEVARGLISILLGVAAAGAVGAVTLRDAQELNTSRAVIVSAAVGLLAVLVSVGTSFVAHGLGTQEHDPPSEFAVVHRPWPRLRPVPVAILPLCLVAPVAYVLFLSVG